ncbi:hypothetical protein B0A48_11402 [Cryoendolithus antarcticus]|uniref:Kri1-like C-terminal domain-containing protein n=1 Tax=Cryoendolithus antarcticus TaxID=1507870 RepID=A0A1V8SVE5_9PEZI|nr:hypothetical protein B0A48_11402 [Cryoendolithus antarcticus]
MDRPAKRTKLLSDSENSDDDRDVSSSKQPTLSVNSSYAARFEHNKKREDLSRLEEKYGNPSASAKPSSNGRQRLSSPHPSDDDSSSGSSEDSDADLVTADVDEEISATLEAIRKKDPRVYDANVKFFRDFEAGEAKEEGRKEKAMTLKDYHRANLMAGFTGAEGEQVAHNEEGVRTYGEEQEGLRRRVVGEMHGLAEGSQDEEEDDFKPKARGVYDSLPTNGVDGKVAKPKKRKAARITETDVASADKDPETFLSNFMAAQAWRPTSPVRPHAFDSDDSDEERRADGFEEAYNLRFEDPALANERLQTFSRDVAKYSVRRDELTGRQKAREREKEKKEAVQREREEEKARFRRLKIEEAEGKVKKIREAAGLSGKDVKIEEWKEVIEGDFDDDQWDAEMKRRFGEGYYAENEGEDDEEEAEDDETNGKKKRKTKKPKWDDDIDIKDLVPEFDDTMDRGDFALTSDEDDEEGGAPLPAATDSDDTPAAPKPKTKASRQKEKTQQKITHRRDLAAITDIVDTSLPLAHPTLSVSLATAKHAPVGFRYRATSPETLGLSSRDILFADDAALNQFAGLKKLAAFRDEGKKAKERGKMSSKKRLKKWRKETFRKSEVPVGGFEVVLGGGTEATGANGEEVGEGGEKKGKKRKRKAKNGSVEKEAIAA